MTPVGSQPNARLLRLHLLTNPAGIQTNPTVSVGDLHVVLGVVPIVMITVAVLVVVMMMAHYGGLPHLRRCFRMLNAVTALTRGRLLFHASPTVNLNHDAGYQFLDAFDFSGFVRFVIGGGFFAVTLTPLGKFPVRRAWLRVAPQ